MTRKDYARIASAMAMAETKCSEDGEYWGVETAVTQLISALSDINPRFDRQAFCHEIESERIRILGEKKRAAHDA